MQKIKKLLFGLVLLGILTSCLSKKRLIYIQNKNFTELNATQIQNPKPEYIIQTNDVLSVQIKSTQTEFNELFNINSPGNNLINSPGSLFIMGYSVSDSGYIVLPTIGKIMVRGLGIAKARTQVEQEVKKFVNNATVDVKLVSFKISVLGEVKSPGYYYVYNNQATIFEGLGLANDITEFGNRNKIKLIRQTATGSEVAILDITNPNILKSKYYYLLPNDVLYVEPLGAKISRGNLQPLGVLFGGITAIAVVLNYINNVK